MEIRIGRGAGKVFNIADWNLTYRPGEIRAHPSAITFARRLLASGAIAAIGGALYWYRDELMMPHEVMLAAYVLLGVLAVMTPLTALWQRVAILGDGRGRLKVTAFLLVPRTYDLATQNIGGIPLLVYEETIRYLRGRLRERIGWSWRAMLDDGRNHLVFIVDRIKTKGDAGATPSRAIEFFKNLQAVSGKPALEPQLVTWGARRTNSYSTGFRQSVDLPPQRHSTRRVYRSLEEMPPELRARAEQMMRQGQARQQRIVIRDAQGNERVYNSIDELPPDIRARFEQTRRGGS